MRVWTIAAAMLAGGAALATALADDGPQRDLEPVVNAGQVLLEYDWPILRIGTGEYPEGPTGVTVFRFDRKVYSAIDIRGGGPGTVNAPYMELGYDIAELDTVVLAGGSWYGLEAVTGVASALKDDGLRDGDAFAVEPSMAMSVGSIVFDFGPRRFNEIYPDKRLAQAAFRAARPGVFPLGAHGGGRFAVSGSFFGCHAKSGQGGAFRQIGQVKIAAFTVVNAIGAVVDRDGRVVACNRGAGWPEELLVKDLLAAVPDSRERDWPGPSRRNTTISLVVVSQKLTPPELKRLAVQVHSSMARAIQPFATIFDGDVLYAVSTAEVAEQVFNPLDLGALASEVMWDAILSSVPPQPVAPAVDPTVTVSTRIMDGLAGDYRFSADVTVRVSVRDGALVAQAVGDKRALVIGKDQPVRLHPLSDREYTVPGRYPFVARFAEGRMIVNPGHWQQVGYRQE